MDKVIFLIDFDAYFINCHAALDPTLNNLPAVVASDFKHGIILTANYKAREIGIATGTPMYQILKKYKNVRIVKNNMDLYTERSNAIFEFIYNNFSKKIEVVSIDECYLDVTDCWKKYKTVDNMSKAIKETIAKEFKQTCSIGISTNKFLAKMASSIKKPNGQYRILPTEIEEKLWPIPIEKMYGVGTATFKKIKEYDIQTIGDLAKFSKDKLYELFKKRGLKIHENANGIDDDQIDLNFTQLSSIGYEISLTKYYNVEEYLIEKLVMLTNNLHKKIIRKKIQFKTITLIYRNKNNLHDKRKTTRTKNLTYYTDSLDILISTILDLFDKNWDRGEIKLLGVRVGELKYCLNCQKQLKIDDILNNENDYYIINTINNSLNEKMLFTGSELLNKIEYNKNNKKFIKSEKDNKK